MSYQREMKGLWLIQRRAEVIDSVHGSIALDLELIRQNLDEQGAKKVEQTPEHTILRESVLEDMNQEVHLRSVTPAMVYADAEALHPDEIKLQDILSINDFEEAQQRISRHILDFNRRYALDAWDYAIAGSCGLFAAMLDLMCVKAPPKPTTAWTQQVDGVFNRWVQGAFNRFIPPELSKKLSDANPIGAPDSSTVFHLIGAPDKALSPMNHRLRSMAHDPVLGLIFGVRDMIHGTCTTIVDGKIMSIPSTKGQTEGNVFQLLGRMFGHLLSDVNAPSARGNRGMGLPAPFMGLLRMFEGIPLGDSNFGRQIEWMYVNGYDFRQFVVTSIPMATMEVLMRAFYVVKQVKHYGAPFGETMLATMPFRLNPRFRIMLALAYGVASSVNAGKVYVTKNLLNANYAAWMGLVWNGFHALRWALYARHIKLWNEVEAREIQELEELVRRLDQMEARAAHLPV